MLLIAAPEKVASLEVTPTARNITITWSEPAVPNGVIQQYIVAVTTSATQDIAYNQTVSLLSSTRAMARFTQHNSSHIIESMSLSVHNYVIIRTLELKICVAKKISQLAKYCLKKIYCVIETCCFSKH